MAELTPAQVSAMFDFWSPKEKEKKKSSKEDVMQFKSFLDSIAK